MNHEHLQKQDVVSGRGWDRTTLSSCWLSEAIKIHSMSSGPLSSGARVNRQSSFTLWPLAFSTNVCSVDVMSRPEANPSRHSHRREGSDLITQGWTGQMIFTSEEKRRLNVLVGRKPLKWMNTQVCQTNWSRREGCERIYSTVHRWMISNTSRPPKCFLVIHRTDNTKFKGKISCRNLGSMNI